MINAEIVADSLSPYGDRLTSVLCTFPRIILAEVNTHRMLSKNTSSSRAIPFDKMVEVVKTNPFIPIAWQKEHKGMQGSEYFLDSEDYDLGITNQWLETRDKIVYQAILLNSQGVTKQLCNRLLEPFMWTTMLITGSREGWDNFFRLRSPVYGLGKSQAEVGTFTQFSSKKDALEVYPEFKDEDTLFWLNLNKGQAEIHMMALAESIWDAFNESTPKQLKAGEWHIPFEDKISKVEIDKVFKVGKSPMNRQEAIVKISTAMGAHTSYTVVGNEPVKSMEKWVELHDKLIAYNPPHSSPMEHCAKCMNDKEYKEFFKGNIMHVGCEQEIYEDSSYSEDVVIPINGQGWCYNLKGFIPYRYIIDNNKL